MAATIASILIGGSAVNAWLRGRIDPPLRSETKVQLPVVERAAPITTMAFLAEGEVLLVHFESDQRVGSLHLLATDSDSVVVTVHGNPPGLALSATGITFHNDPTTHADYAIEVPARIASIRVGVGKTTLTELPRPPAGDSTVLAVK